MLVIFRIKNLEINLIRLNQYNRCQVCQNNHLVSTRDQTKVHCLTLKAFWILCCRRIYLINISNLIAIPVLKEC